MSDKQLPQIWAGPILRRVTPKRLTFWLASSQALSLRLELFPEKGDHQQLDEHQLQAASRVLKAGNRLLLYLIDLPLDRPLPQDCWIAYDLHIKAQGAENWLSVVEWAGEQICYPGKDLPGFRLESWVSSLLHGSCRKPHHPSEDGLVRADKHLATYLEDAAKWPAFLVMSGDQVYADDVAGPMLVAIHRLLPHLELPSEPLEGVQVADSVTLHTQEPHYYLREGLLPSTAPSGELLEVFFKGVKKPVFTSDNAHNHLITLGEVLAMYLLVWSPVPWQELDLSPPAGLDDKTLERYQQERQRIENFAEHLAPVRRVLAHLPVAMIFDDHDITDDWNLTAAWEKVAYEHDFSRRIIGNALIGYLLFQGWGNAPEQFPGELLEQVQQVLTEPGGQRHDELISTLLKYPNWHYQWPTDPPLLVLDTRTHRWRSEKSLNNPSGLMDWEAITDLQIALLDKQAVIMVSAAPVFGVKLIEVVQRIFTWFGKPLMVDAENWMAHRGASLALMSLFRHSRTPRNFVILSGDVHYSFVYDVELRGVERGPDIWQITSSGIKNTFPPRLLDIFDRGNRWLYAPWSPLNWFTKRRNMRVIPRKPDDADFSERLVNACGIGYVELNQQGRPSRICQLCTQDKTLEFHSQEEEARWE